MKTQEATTTTTTTKKAANKAKATKGAGKPAAKEAAAKTAKGTKTPKAKPEAKDAARARSKTAIILDLLRRKDGATLAEIAKATNWLSQSIRGFLSGQISNKMGLKLESEKVDGERRYRLA